MWYDNLARAYGHNMAKIIKVLIGRNPKKDFRVKNPLVLPNLNIEGDSKTESRRQSFCYFNAKVSIIRGYLSCESSCNFFQLAKEFITVNRESLTLKTARKKFKQELQKKLFAQLNEVEEDFISRLVSVHFIFFEFARVVLICVGVLTTIESENQSKFNSKMNSKHDFKRIDSDSSLLMDTDDKEVLKILQTAKKVLEKSLRQETRATRLLFGKFSK